MSPEQENSYQYVAELLDQRPEISDPQDAYRLFGHTESDYRQLQAIVTPEIKQEALVSLGFSVHTDRHWRQRQGNGSDGAAVYGRAQITIPNFFNTRSDVIENIVSIVAEGTPAGKSTALILSDHPDSALFDAVEPEHLLLFVSPRQRRVTTAPGPDWEEIPGGWRRGRRIQSRDSLFLTAGRDGLLRYSAAQRPRLLEKFSQLCAGAWPDDGPDSEQLDQASDELERIASAQRILEEMAAFRRENFPDLDERRRSLIYNREQAERYRQRIAQFTEEMNNHQATAEEISTQISEQEPQMTLDSRAKMEAVCADLQAVAGLSEEFDYVQEATLNNPFLGRAELRVVTNIPGGDSGRPLTFYIDQDGVRFLPQVDLDIEGRVLAICEKFSRGQFAEAVRMVCQPLLRT
jgi:hypothetical protein